MPRKSAGRPVAKSLSWLTIVRVRGAGKLADGTPMLLHLWLVMTRQAATDGGNGTITMQGYAMFEPVDHILVINMAGHARSHRFSPPS